MPGFFANILRSEQIPYDLGFKHATVLSLFLYPWFDTFWWTNGLQILTWHVESIPRQWSADIQCHEMENILKRLPQSSFLDIVK